MNGQITTARLPLETRNKLLALARSKGKTKSDIIKESLEMYYEREEREMDSFFLGERFFGSYGSGEPDRAVSYKERMREKLRSRMPTESGALGGAIGGAAGGASGGAAAGARRC